MRIDHLALPEPEAVTLLKDEVRRLRAAIAALADQDATLAVQGGDVIVTMDATLTDEERSAVAASREFWLSEAACELRDETDQRYADALGGLLERLG